MFHIGTAIQEITPPIGSMIQGATVMEGAKSIRDPLEANGLYITDGTVRILLVGLDVAGIETPNVKRLREAMAEASGLAPRDIILFGTHMHSGPSVIPTCYGKPVDTNFLDTRLPEALQALAKKAVDAATPARLGWGVGTAQIGYNRRCCWEDGSHSMHGDTSRPDFTGLEGPIDPQHTSLVAVDENNRPLAILYNNTTHPTTFYGADFFSADFPGVARQYFRDLFGNIPVLFMNGAFGDISQENQESRARHGETKEQKMARLAHIVCGETLCQIHSMEFTDSAPLGHVVEDLPISVRLPDAERLERSRELLRRVDAGESVCGMEIISAHGAVKLADAFGQTPVDHLALHAIRIGDLAILTQPCELFCQFGLDIKRRSPAPITAVGGIADGYSGYCPTVYGAMAGGYSGEAIYWTRLAEDGGYRIADAGARLLHQLWKA